VQNDEDDDVMGAREYSLMKRKTDERRRWKFFSPHASRKLSEGHPEKFQGSLTTGLQREAPKEKKNDF
jgi:hypothetical protein